jgi:hypothetical protein
MLTTTTETTALDVIPIESKNYIKKRWDNLQSKGNLLDFDRAKLLHGVWNRLNRADSVLVHFLVSTLGEFPGKRCTGLVRLVHAYDKIDSQVTWQMVGGSPVTTLARLSGSNQRKVMVKVRQTLRSTERETISRGTFARLVKAAVGDEKYQEALNERRGKSTVRAELAVLKKFLLTLLNRHPEFRREIPKAVAESLALDLVAD